MIEKERERKKESFPTVSFFFIQAFVIPLMHGNYSLTLFYAHNVATFECSHSYKLLFSLSLSLCLCLTPKIGLALLLSVSKASTRAAITIYLHFENKVDTLLPPHSLLILFTWSSSHARFHLFINFILCFAIKIALE